VVQDHLTADDRQRDRLNYEAEAVNTVMWFTVTTVDGGIVDPSQPSGYVAGVC
jgi:hypothetical protein